jgi:hypothetical protein
MKICSLQFWLTAMLGATLFLVDDNKHVVAQPQVEVPHDVEHSGEMMEDANCHTGNGECLNSEAAEPSTTVTELTNEDPNCPSREHVIRCAGLHLDTNKNGLLERSELQDAIDRLPWYGRGELHDNPDEHGDADYWRHCVFSFSHFLQESSRFWDRLTR